MPKTMTAMDNAGMDKAAMLSRKDCQAPSLGTAEMAGIYY